MNKENTDKIYNAITSNGCREMDEERFHQAVNELLEVENKLKKNHKEKPLDIGKTYAIMEMSDGTFDLWSNGGCLGKGLTEKEVNVIIYKP